MGGIGSGHPGKKGCLHHLWKGGISLDKAHDNRALIWCRDGRRRIFARAVMESILGREILSSEIVHHINGDPTDDRPENLELMTLGEHSRHHNSKGDKDE